MPCHEVGWSAPLPFVREQPGIMQAAVKIGEILGRRFKERHDPKGVAVKMQAIMVEKFEGPQQMSTCMFHELPSRDRGYGL